MLITRDKTRRISVGGLSLGGGAPVRVQSMTKTDTRDVKSTISEIKRLVSVGCEIVRVAVPDMDAALKIKEIKKHSPIPLVADIHFDWRLAIASIKSGADKIRINPGNFPREYLKSVISEARSAHIPIRIGVNIGSLKSAQGRGLDISKKSDALASTAIKWCREISGNYGFEDIVVSIKASDVPTTIEAYKKFAHYRDAIYPLHIGITEAGPVGSGSIKSAAGLGALLYLGLGDTIRVSLTADATREVEEAYILLQAMGLRSGRKNFDIISCPTCGRCASSKDMPDIVHVLEKRLDKIFEKKSKQSHVSADNKRVLKIAVMGCVVNGPGEARDADIGVAIAGGREAVLFKNGLPTDKKISVSQIAKVLSEEILKFKKNF